MRACVYEIMRKRACVYKIMLMRAYVYHIFIKCVRAEMILNLCLGRVLYGGRVFWLWSRIDRIKGWLVIGCCIEPACEDRVTFVHGSGLLASCDWSADDVLDQLVTLLSALTVKSDVLIIDGINLICTLIKDTTMGRNGIVSFVDKLCQLDR